MKLNGWVRIWIVLTALYSLIAVPLAIDADANLGEWIAGCVPPLLLLALGWAIAWVVRGFRRPAA